MTAPISNKLALAGALIFGAETGGFVCDVFGLFDSRGQDSGSASNFLFGVQQVLDVPIVGRGIATVFGAGPWAGRQGQPGHGNQLERYPGVAYSDATNEVQTMTFGGTAAGGSMTLSIPLRDGTMATTGLIAWNTTDATWLAAINTALDAATGVAGGIVATGATPDTALTFTLSGTGYAARSWGMISALTVPTGALSGTVVRTTTGVGAGQHCLPCQEVVLTSNWADGHNFQAGWALADLLAYRRSDWTAGKAITGRIIFRGAAANVTGSVIITAGRNTDATYYPYSSYSENDATSTVNMVTPTGIRYVEGLCGSGAGSPTIGLIEPVSHGDETGKGFQIPLVYFYDPAATGGVRMTAVGTSTFTTVDLYGCMGGGVAPLCFQADTVAFFQAASPSLAVPIKRVVIVDLGTNHTAAETTDYNASGYSVYKANIRNLINQINIVWIVAFGKLPECIWLRTPFVSKGGSTSVAALQAQALYELSNEFSNVCYDNLSGRVTAVHWQDTIEGITNRGSFYSISTEDNIHPTGKASAHPGDGDIAWASPVMAGAQSAYRDFQSVPVPFRIDRIPGR